MENHKTLELYTVLINVLANLLSKEKAKYNFMYEKIQQIMAIKEGIKWVFKKAYSFPIHPDENSDNHDNF
jgi:hypothetical protein